MTARKKRVYSKTFSLLRGRISCRFKIYRTGAEDTLVLSLCLELAAYGDPLPGLAPKEAQAGA